MPPRACIICGQRAVAGRSRCSRHGRSTPRGPSGYDAEHRRLAQKTVRAATVCVTCGNPPTPANPLEGGHIVSRKHGGQNVEANYHAQCRACNRADGARLAREGRGGRFSGAP